MKLRSLLLDLDGTVLDTHGLILGSWHHVRDTFGLPHGDELFMDQVGRPLAKIFEAFSDEPAHRDEMIRVFRAHNAETHDALVRPFPGMVDALDALRDRGVRLAVVTSKSSTFAERGLRVTGLRDRFDVVIGADDVVRHKPDPEPVHAALAGLGAVAGAACMVGDAPFDLQAGRAAGVRTGAALWGPFDRALLVPHAPDHWLDTPGDLVRVVEEDA